jgi:hypothetical protein
MTDIFCGKLGESLVERFDIRCGADRGLVVERISNPKLHQEHIFAYGPLISNIRTSNRRGGMRMLESATGASNLSNQPNTALHRRTAYWK